MTLGSSSASLTIADHTRIMEVVTDRALIVGTNLSYLEGAPPTAYDVIDAALLVRSIDDDVKSSLRAVAELLPSIEAAQAELPAELIDAMSQLQAEMSGLSVEEKFVAIEQFQLRNLDHESLGLASGFAADILQDGAATLYSPTCPLVDLIESLNPTDSDATDIAGVDMIGAGLGGLASLALGAGPLPGAAAGAAGASLGALGYVIAVHLMR